MLGALGGVTIIGIVLSRSPAWAIRFTLLYGLVAVLWSFNFGGLL